eukprot:1734034-Lingulodinium_polyedra.AAC.1
MGKRASGGAPAITKKRATGKQPEEGAGVPREAGAPGGPQEKSRTVEFIDEHIMPYIGDALASMRPEHSVARGGVHAFAKTAFKNAMAVDGFYECTMPVAAFKMREFSHPGNPPTVGAIIRLQEAVSS